MLNVQLLNCYMYHGTTERLHGFKIVQLYDFCLYDGTPHDHILKVITDNQ